ncbi:MAG: hypothetical protein COV34_01320 [Candidatus Zambryskibacteria bacterium CG10_big_fil_rev_8_21_14_0_10_42_12]|uniref:Methyltransferase domain-containing protein n=1 Tax=Candidatus Zambryskibacteria bacterium CG10_big_fil_rev_8_21_14_0_10_42_12 TaxID=1975115 RepID=A0A2H0QVG8_9BACT|nr:MAG: hypothetical protein COV34_01320 [Candidatus Zambryskibacteria bacterium CG10_big_fil_rev_8_21_14_0_10_42_12]
MFSNPIQNVPRFGLKPGMKVADFGSGSGTYARELAHFLGPDGKVYAVDIQRELLNNLVAEAGREGLRNIEPVWADLEKVEGSNIPSNTLDAVVISNILFQVGNKEGLLREAVRVTHPYGKVILIDWIDSFGNLGPHQGSVVTRDDAVVLADKVGLSLRSEFEAGSNHYGLIFEKKSQ